MITMNKYSIYNYMFIYQTMASIAKMRPMADAPREGRGGGAAEGVEAGQGGLLGGSIEISFSKRDVLESPHKICQILNSYNFQFFTNQEALIRLLLVP